MVTWRTARDQHTPWQGLGTLCAIRAVVALVTAAAAIVMTSSWARPINIVSFIYVGLVIWSAPFAIRKRPGFAEQLAAIIAVDVLFIALMVFLGDGFRGGMPLLFFVPVVGAALLAELPIALCVSAIASLVLLAESLIRELTHGDPTYFQAGILGAALFAAAVVLNRLAARILAQERLVREKNIQLQLQIEVNLAVINEMREGILVVSPEGQVSAANPAARRILHAPEFENERDFGHWVAMRYPALSRLLTTWALSGPVDNRAWTVLLESEEVPPLGAHSGEDPARAAKRVRLRPIRLAAGTMGDNTPLLASVEDLRELEAQATQLKLASMGRLSASIAHEIRNPLAAIGHAAALMAEDEANTASRLLRIVQDNVRRIDRIVEDVLSVSRSSRVRAETLPLAITVKSVVDEFVRDQQIPAQRFAVDVDPKLSVTFDRSHLTQILVNLIGNATRYASEQPVAIEITADRDGEGQGIALTVADDGAGVDAETRAHLFEPFFTTWRKGTGLGLYLARDLALANGAELVLDDATRRRGAAFTLRMADITHDAVTHSP
ncbi:ATP-binding protein [soil metagenome]